MAGCIFAKIKDNKPIAIKIFEKKKIIFLYFDILEKEIFIVL